MLKNIIFDLGGVLVDWNPSYLYTEYFETEEGMKKFFDNVCTFDWNEAQDGGRPIEEANKLLINKFPEYTTEILAFYGRWKEMLGGPIAGTVDILSQIKAKNQYSLTALTNWSAETWPIAIEEYEFLSWFEGIVVSGIEKMKKPNPDFYELILSRYGLVASESLFIDDNKRNVLAARNLGIQIILFTSPEQLRSELTHLGILK